ncbi:MAG TPA: ABC transporter permease [Gemmatimonadaceae bacterium]|nr:ABC transporter permease [Gemmatimonadaceae bacterium]
MSHRTWRDSQLVQLTLVRFREFLREPEALFWVFIFPILMAAGLGIAFRSRGADSAVVAVVERPAPNRLDFVKLLSGAQGIEVRAMTMDSAIAALRAGRVALVAVDAGAGRVDYRFDPSRDESRTARVLFNDALQRALGRVDPLPVVDTHVTERGSRYIDFVIPGLLGMNLLGSGVWGLGFALVDMRRKKLLKRLVATPMSRAQFLLSFLLSRLVLLVLEVSLLIGFGVVAFHVPLSGPLWVLALVCVLGSLCFSGLGLLISSRVRTVEGASGLMNAAMLPMWILSGVFFSSSHFPAVMQPLVHALPLTAVNDALRANMLEGASVANIVPELAIIAGWTVVCFGLALRLFRWK